MSLMTHLHTSLTNPVHFFASQTRVIRTNRLSFFEGLLGEALRKKKGEEGKGERLRG